jgi:hypothetical protein
VTSHPDPPPDPLFEPPADLDVCSVCKGRGEYRSYRQDWETGAYPTVECQWCETTGFQPVGGVPGWIPLKPTLLG